MFSNTEELLPVISFNAKTSTDEQKKHDDFVDRMMEKATPASRFACCANGICAYVNRPKTSARQR
jgi:predicted Ser/Thr protein kinase